MPTAERVAVVSGGNRGLGLETVRRLAGLGMRVVLGSRSITRGQSAVELLGDLADQVAVRQLDITSVASVDALATWLRHRLGRCDVLVNSGALLVDEERDPTEVDLDVVRAVIETNLLGTWRLTQAVAPLMRGHRYGRIVNVTTGLDAAPTGRTPAGLHVSTCAISGMTRLLARDLAPDNILVNACELDRSHPGGHASAERVEWLAVLPDDGPTGVHYRGQGPAQT